MRKTSLLFAAAAVFGIAAGPVQAEDKTVNGTATADILDPLMIMQSNGIAFGKIDRPSMGNTQNFVVPVIGQPTVSGTGGGAFIGGGQMAGKFVVMGRVGQSVFIQSGTPTCDQNDVTLTVQPAVANDVGVVLTATGYEYLVGGTLAVSGATEPGIKRCSYTVTASYDNVF